MAPRSITQYLEEKIAAAERKISLNDSFPVGSLISHYSSHPSSSALVTLGNTTAGSVLSDITPSFLGLINASRLAGCVAVQTQIPTVQSAYGVSDLNETHPRPIIHQQSSVLCPTSVPNRVAEFLLSTYTSRIIHQCPVVCEEEAKATFNAVLSSSSCHPRDLFVVSLIMAISLSTSARNNLARAKSLAGALFKYGMMQLSAALTNDLQGLQALLLLIHYTFLNPTVGNLWLLTGISNEACIDLGLHQELLSFTDQDASSLNVRRRIFWCAWEMEIAVSAAFRRPIRILNRHINVCFPDPCQPYSPSFPALSWIPNLIWRFRQIEAELVSVLHLNHPLPPDVRSLETWMIGLEKKAFLWAQEVQQLAAYNDSPLTKSQWSEMLNYANIAHNYCLVLLYGPSNKVKAPTRPSLMRAFQASVRVAEAYWEQTNTEFGRIKYTFHTCYHTFSAAIVFLKVLQSCISEINELFSLDEIHNFAQCFVRLLSSLGERWPAATRCLEEYNLLLNPIMETYSNHCLSMQQVCAVDYLPPQINLYYAPPPSNVSFSQGSDAIHYEDFTHIFNPPLGAMSEPLFGFPTDIPFDWDTEFDFGMDTLLDVAAD
ncbi:fungal specific transcription factor domain-containing protein [Aspergillus stella-maris]|uniref:fungal specific transcription factor domain-containing protein n=1 Tax=Aspergillus stella-maris TaxID=1810926 RepID=UPI003CCD16AC